MWCCGWTALRPREHLALAPSRGVDVETPATTAPGHEDSTTDVELEDDMPSPHLSSRSASHRSPTSQRSGTQRSQLSRPSHSSEEESSYQLTRWDDIGASSLKRALRCVTLVDAAWLADLADGGGVLPRCQEVPPAATVSLEQMEAWKFGVALLVISCPWLGQHHPDPLGEQLRRIAFVLRAFSNSALNAPNSRVGVFWDYLALPQATTDGEDDRSPSELVRFDQGLRTLNVFFGHPNTFVLLVTRSPSAAREHTNVEPFDGRGWCVAERTMSAIVKASFNLIDLSLLDGTSTSFVAIIDKGRSKRQPPVAPDAFRSFLEAGVKNGSIKFSVVTDLALVAGIYQRAFVDELSVATALSYARLGWGDEEVATLAAALEHAHKRGVLGRVEKLWLHSNSMGCAGAAALAAACTTGALATLETLSLDYNRIGDDGMRALAKAVSMGALPVIVDLRLEGNPGSAAAVQQALEDRRRQASWRHSAGGCAFTVVYTARAN
jgi:hypothetical protein